MKYSHLWLQDYLEDTLPDSVIVEEALNLKAFEVEGIEKVGYIQDGIIVNDTIYDIKVLPNRAHDALSHFFMAHEIAACLDLKKRFGDHQKTDYFKNYSKDLKDIKIKVNIGDRKACTRFAYAYMSNIKVGPSPEIIKNRLEAIGVRSINNIVDITNYVQYSINKPMHAYDADQLKGDIEVRYATQDEELETLDDKILNLGTSDLVIADQSKALGLAGVKGGKSSGINKSTQNIFIESANFNPILIRKSSVRNNIKTDASKRFENGISDELVVEGLTLTIDLILKYIPECKLEYVVDTNSEYIRKYKIGVSLSEINKVLGSNLSDNELIKVLLKLGYKYDYVKPIQIINEIAGKITAVPYKRGASVSLDAPRAFDCSSLTNYIYSEAWGIIPRMAIDQYVFASEINVENRAVGDLIFIRTGITSEKKNTNYSQVLGLELADLPIRDESLEYLRGTRVEGGIDHVGIYIGDNKVLHTSSISGLVVEDINESHLFAAAQKSYRRIENNLDEKRYIIEVDNKRLDLKHKEDIIEEIGRIYGYDKLERKLPVLTTQGEVNRVNKLNSVIRETLILNGFDEIINYSLVQNGEIHILKSASDKSSLRSELAEGMIQSINKNVLNMPLLNVNKIKMFEIGNVWISGGEETHLVIGIDDGKKKSSREAEMQDVIQKINSKINLPLNFELKSSKPLTYEVNLSNIQDLDAIDNVTGIVNYEVREELRYSRFSVMPFVVRDIAFWIKNGQDVKEIEDIIKLNAGDLCVSCTPFDQYSKEGRTSYGYRLVYQADDRTLVDEEVNIYADLVYNKLKLVGAEIR
jgi:phenylalanyl-tRNA synthetase beta subunit